MANTTVLRPAGKTAVIAVTATSSSITIDDTTNDQVTFASFINAGTKACAVTVSSLATAPVSVFPTTGTPGDFVLPASMTLPITLAVPTAPFQITEICGGSDTTTLYVTPVVDQS